MQESPSRFPPEDDEQNDKNEHKCDECDESSDLLQGLSTAPWDSYNSFSDSIMNIQSRKNESTV